MAGRNPYEAVTNFLEPLNLAVSMFTRDQLSLSPGGRHPRAEEDPPHSVILNRGQLSRLRRDPALGLLLALHYDIVEAKGELGPWKTTCTKYEYAFHWWDDPQRELLAFHWHPEDPSVDWPHVHLKAEVLHENAPFTGRKLRLPTGRISVEYVLQMAVMEMGAEALDPDRWDEVLRASEEIFRTYRTWG